ncbi:hypothetical protein NN561_007471 [Cricetulus griseus]
MKAKLRRNIAAWSSKTCRKACGRFKLFPFSPPRGCRAGTGRGVAGKAVTHCFHWGVACSRSEHKAVGFRNWRFGATRKPKVQQILKPSRFPRLLGCGAFPGLLTAQAEALPECGLHGASVGGGYQLGAR